MLCARDIQCRRAAPRLQKMPLNAGRKALNRQAVLLIVQYLLSLIDECHIHSMSICGTVHDIIINQTQIKKAINRLFPQCVESCKDRICSFFSQYVRNCCFYRSKFSVISGNDSGGKKYRNHHILALQSRHSPRHQDHRSRVRVGRGKCHALAWKCFDACCTCGCPVEVSFRRK